VTSTMPWRAAIGKELRALLPAWMALAIASIVCIAFDGRWSWAIFIFGAVALGALSIGHEYLHGTLSPWLALPVNRWQLAVAKLAALLPLLASLAILATLGLVAANGLPAAGLFRLELMTIGLPLIYGLIVAPWLTMVARGPLGGVVFTLAVPLVVGLALFFIQPLDVFVRPGFGTAMSVFAGLGVLLGARTFMQLEALDTHRDVELPKLFGARRALEVSGAPRPIWALIAKEFRLQQMTVLVATLSFAAVLVARWYHSLAPDTNLDLTYALGVVHLALVPILAGALASAEERRLGTLEWQVLQPIATWRQWLVKVTVVVALSIVVSLVPLVLLLGADRPAHVIWVLKSVLTLTQAIIIVAELAIATLYVSSLSTSGIRAIMTSIPVLAVLAALMSLFPRMINLTSNATAGFRTGLLQTSMDWLVARWAPAGFSQRTANLILGLRSGLALAFFVGLSVVVLRFALVNHRSAERGGRRVVRQAAMFFGWVLVIQFIFTSLSALQAAGFYRITPEERKVFSESMVRRARWQHELDVLTKGFDGRVGACAGDGRLEACISDNNLFPMQSVMKLPVAVSALEAVDAGKWRLDDEVVVHKQDLSVFVQPIAKLVGPNGFKTTIGDLVRRAIVDSDSAATDILIAKLGGPGAVQLTLNRKATSAVRVDRDEKHLQTEINGLEWRDEYLDPPALDRAINAVPEAQRDAAFQAYLHDRRDTSTPRGMTILLDKLVKGRLLSSSSTQFLLDTLKQTTTFPDRLKAGVPDGWTIGHKTGTSGSWRGVTAAFNDVGILTGPKGETISIAVFITESKASDKDVAKLMADIARAIATKY
jgi:beta-lactamase class A